MDGIRSGTVGVTNSGTVTGGYTGISGAAAASVTNYTSGIVSGVFYGISAPTTTVTNFGTAYGPTGINSTDTATVINSGAITGTTADGIVAGTALVTNSGTISGRTRGISAHHGHRDQPPYRHDHRWRFCDFGYQRHRDECRYDHGRISMRFRPPSASM